MHPIESVDREFKPIKIHDIFPDQVLGFDIYIYLPTNKKCIKYIKAHDTINEKQLNRLKLRHINELFIHKDDIDKYNKYVSLSIRSKLDEADEEQKQDIIKSCATDILSAVDTLTSDEDKIAWTNNCIEITKVVINDLTDSNISNIFDKLQKFLSDSPTVVNHSLCVSSLGTIIAMTLGIYSSKSLSEIALGGLLHDIGLSRVSEETIEKFMLRKEFTTREETEFYRHPQEGIKILGKTLKSKHITDNVLQIVLEHHENLQGTGFPRNIPGLKLSYLTKIIGIADRLALDVFNSEKASFKYHVLRLLKEQEMKKELDITILNKILETV